jgi:hypothetical protein
MKQIIQQGQSVIYRHPSHPIKGVILESGEQVSKILWFDDEEENGWIISDWCNEDFEIIDNKPQVKK